MMKILQILPAFYPAHAYGGTVEVAYQLSMKPSQNFDIINVEGKEK